MCILFTLVLSESLLLVYLSIRYFYTALRCCLFISLPPYFFLIMLLLYFCLFINYVNKSTTFVFGAFVCHFKNTISIFVTICMANDFCRNCGGNKLVKIVLYLLVRCPALWLRRRKHQSFYKANDIIDLFRINVMSLSDCIRFEYEQI